MHGRRLEKRATELAHVRCGPSQARHLVAISRRHQAPERQHTLTSICLVQVMVYARTVSTEARRNLQSHSPWPPQATPALENVLTVELVQRHITNRRLSRRTVLTSLSPPAPAQQLQPPIKLIHATIPNHRSTRSTLRKMLSTFKHTRALRVQVVDGHHRQNQRQTKAQMNGFKDPIVTTAERLRIELLEPLPHQVQRIALARILADLVDGFAQHLLHRLRIPRRLHRVLRYVLHDRPEVQQRPPVDVAKVCEQHVRLITTHKLVVPRETQIELTFTIPTLQASLLGARLQLVRKAVAAIWTLRLATRTWILLQDWRQHPMAPIVARALVHQCRHKLAHSAQVHLRRRRSIWLLEHALEQGPQAHRVRRRSHIGAKVLQAYAVDVNLNVMSPDVLVPRKAHATILPVARVPLRRLIVKVRPKLRLLLLLRDAPRFRSHRQRGLWLARPAPPTTAPTRASATSAPSPSRSFSWPRGIFEKSTRLRRSLVTTTISVRSTRARSGLLGTRTLKSNNRSRPMRNPTACLKSKRRPTIVQGRVPCAVRNTMPMRITIGASFEAPHAQTRLRLRVRQYGRHDHFHMQLSPHRVHVRDNVRRIPHKAEAHAPRSRIIRTHGLPRQSVANVQAMHLVVEVIPQVQGIPCRRDPAVANAILHHLVLTHEALAHHILGTTASLDRHPRRSPRHMLHNAIHPLALPRPLHRCRPHILPHCHQGMDKLPRRFLALQDALQTLPSERLLRPQARTHSP